MKKWQRPDWHSAADSASNPDLSAHCRSKAAGTWFALCKRMGVKRLEDLIALQLATEFKREVYRLVQSSPSASKDLRYKDQLFDAASGVEANIQEGWSRFQAREFAQFLRYARGSLGESTRRLRDGIDRAYFTGPDCRHALALADRCSGAVTNLLRSLQRFSGSRKTSRV